MKKTMLFLLGAAALATMASCDTKSCTCYVYDGVNTPYIETQYVSESSPCSSLDYQSGVAYRTCTEYGDPTINPGDIGREYKK